MSENSKFDVYIGKFIPTIGVPVVLITGEKDSDILYSEYHIFLQDENKDTYFSSIYKCGNINFPDVLKIDVDYMMNKALEVAQGEIVNYIFHKFKDSKNFNMINYNVELEKWSPAPLLQLYVEDKFRKEIGHISNKSKSKKLRDYLNGVLGKILNIAFSSGTLKESNVKAKS